MANILEQAVVSAKELKRNIVSPALWRRQMFADNILLVPVIADVLASPYNHNRRDPAVSDALFPQFQDSRRVYWRKDYRGRIQTSEQVYRAGITDFGKAYFAVCREVYNSLDSGGGEPVFDRNEMMEPDSTWRASWMPALVVPLVLTAESVEESRSYASSLVYEVYAGYKSVSDIAQRAANAAEFLFVASSLPDASPSQRVETLKDLLSREDFALPEPFDTIVPGMLTVPVDSSALLVKKVISDYCVQNSDASDYEMPGVAGAYCGAVSVFLTGQFSPRMVTQFMVGEFMSKDNLYILSALENMEHTLARRSVEREADYLSLYNAISAAIDGAYGVENVELARISLAISPDLKEVKLNSGDEFPPGWIIHDVSSREEALDLAKFYFPESLSAPGVEREVFHVVSLEGAEPVYVLSGSTEAADSAFRRAVMKRAEKDGRHPRFVASLVDAEKLVEASRVHVNYLNEPLDDKAFFSLPDPEIRTIFFDTVSETLSSPITSVPTDGEKRTAKISGLTIPAPDEKLLNFSKFSNGCAELMHYWRDYLKNEHHFVYPKDAGNYLLRLPTGICLSYKDTDRSIAITDGAKLSVFGFDDLGVARVLTSREESGYNYENVGTSMTEHKKAYDATVPLLPHDVSLESFVEVIKNLIDGGGVVPDDEKRDKIRSGDADMQEMMAYEYSISNYERTRSGLSSLPDELESVPLELQAVLPSGFVPAGPDAKRKVLKVYEPGQRLSDVVMARSYAGTLFTAGTGINKEAEFAALMKRFGIQRVIWLSPYSPSKTMKSYLSGAGVTLNEWGDFLNPSYGVFGAKPVIRPTDSVFHDKDFLDDLGAIRERVEQGYRVCVVDTAQHPFSNRAFQLMGRYFPHHENPIPVGFIYSTGNLEFSQDIESRMVRQYGVGKDCFTVSMAYKAASDLQAGRHKKGDLKIYLEDTPMVFLQDCVRREIVHKKGTPVYDIVDGETVPRVYKDDVLSKSGAVIHEKGSPVCYSRDYYANVSHKAGEVIKDAFGNPMMHKAGEVMKDASGRPLVWESETPNEVLKNARDRRFKRKR